MVGKRELVNLMGGFLVLVSQFFHFFISNLGNFHINYEIDRLYHFRIQVASSPFLSMAAPAPDIPSLFALHLWPIPLASVALRERW